MCKHIDILLIVYLIKNNKKLVLCTISGRGMSSTTIHEVSIFQFFFLFVNIRRPATFERT